MGYEHRWTRPERLPADIFAAWSADMAHVIAHSEIPLVGVERSGRPITSPTLVAFNGDPQSFTKPEDYIRFFVDRGMESDKAAYYAQWYIGTGAQETFYVAQASAGGIRSTMTDESIPPSYSESCKTQGKPYDEVVTAALALLAHRFPRLCYVSSDGSAKNWRDGLSLVQRSLGLHLRVPSYHHWWRCPPQRDAEAFALWRDDVSRVIAVSPVAVAGPDGAGQPIISPSLVSFNGMNNDACDPFTVESQRAPFFQSCRTAQRPYDLVVTAAIILLTYHYRHLVPSQRVPGGKPIITDGEIADWQPGLMLVRQATGRNLENPWLD